ncbi:hypothetical protein GCM10010425_75340 [Streptomyces spororaveus]|uniref:Secreted protein n=1 Tax=Streptomyces spororaveus TaxID=284039 RepID=A0ABQ3TMR8_9ACTN|nr:hypothetical protein Sspor_72760 [Streptomyces spororaveus]
MGCPAAAVAAPTPSQAAAPDSECAGPIMVVSRPGGVWSGPVDCFVRAASTAQRTVGDLRSVRRFPDPGGSQARWGV